MNSRKATEPEELVCGYEHELLQVSTHKIPSGSKVFSRDVLLFLSMNK